MGNLGRVLGYLTGSTLRRTRAPEIDIVLGPFHEVGWRTAKIRGFARDHKPHKVC